MQAVSAQQRLDVIDFVECIRVIAVLPDLAQVREDIDRAVNIQQVMADTIIRHAHIILIEREVLEILTIEAVNAQSGTRPDKAVLILEDIERHGARQPVGEAESAYGMHLLGEQDVEGQKQG